MSLVKKIQDKKQKEVNHPHLIVTALAGVGKTTTGISGLNLMLGHPVCITPSPQQEEIWKALLLSKGDVNIGFTSFSKTIVNELKEEVPAEVSASTIHSIGFKAISRALPFFPKVDSKDGDHRTKEHLQFLTKKTIQCLFKNFPVQTKAACKLTSLCKVNLLDGVDSEQDDLAFYHDIELGPNPDKVFKMTRDILDLSKDVERDREISYDDMVWLPLVNNYTIPQFQLLLVDEAQDLNRAQQEIVLKAGKRLIFVGDPHQAIFGFAGADSESMSRLRKRLSETSRGCITLPLTVTRRCGKAIVREAQKIVPEFTAHEDLPEGEVCTSSFKGKTDYANSLQPQDMVVCRANAPLVRECFRLLSKNIRVKIRGRSIGTGLKTLIKKANAESLPDLIKYVEDWKDSETAKEKVKKVPSEGKLQTVEDKANCVLQFCDNASSVNEVKEKIDDLFTDFHNDKTLVMMSSIHRAKGLEADNVVLLLPKDAPLPHPKAKGWQYQEQMNLLYVAQTRAKLKLTYVY